MKSKKNLRKICSIALVALLVVLCLSSCKKKESETKPVANPSALVNKDSVVQNDDNLKSSIVTVPVPLTVEPPVRSVVEVEAPTETATVETKTAESVVSVDNNRDYSNNNTIEETKVQEYSKDEPVIMLPIANVDTVTVEVITDEPREEEVVEEPLEEISVEEKAVVIDDDVIVSDVFSYEGISVSIIAKSDEAVFSFNEPYPSLTFIINLFDKVIDQYPMLYEAVSYEFDGEKLVLTYPEGYFGKTKDEIYGNLIILRDIAVSLFENTVTVADNVFSREYQLYGKKVIITAGLDSAFITSDSVFTQNEIYEAIEILKANFPEESKYVIYTLKEDGIVLNYPTVDKSYITVALDALQDLILAYTPMPLVELLDDTVVAEVTPTITPEEVIPVAEEEKKEEVITVEPLTDAGKKLSKISLGLSVKGELDFSYPASPFVLGMEVRGGYKITDRFDAGLKLGYDLSGYLPIKGYLKYNFPNPVGLYLFGEAGVSIGVGGRDTGLLLGAGVGYEVEVIEDISIFGEAGVTYRTNADKKISPYLAVGAKYTF